MRYGDEQVQVLEWAYGALAASQALADALGVPLATLDDRVWPDVAPTGTASPWVVYSIGETLDTPALGGQDRLMTTVPLIVKVVGQATSYTPLAPAARALYEATHGTDNVPLAEGGTILTVRRTGGIGYPETQQGIQYRHLGHTLQVNVQ